MAQTDWNWENINKLSGHFGSNTNFEFEELTETSVTGHAYFTSEHHQPWGVVHGGAYATIVESVASVAASYAVRDQGMYSVGVHNGTDFLRPFVEGRVDVTAQALFQGRTQQLWEVVISDHSNGKVLARGQLRLANVPVPSNEK